MDANGRKSFLLYFFFLLFTRQCTTVQRLPNYVSFDGTPPPRVKMLAEPSIKITTINEHRYRNVRLNRWTN